MIQDGAKWPAGFWTLRRLCGWDLIHIMAGRSIKGCPVGEDFLGMYLSDPQPFLLTVSIPSAHPPHAHPIPTHLMERSQALHGCLSAAWHPYPPPAASPPIYNWYPRRGIGCRPHFEGLRWKVGKSWQLLALVSAGGPHCPPPTHSGNPKMSRGGWGDGKGKVSPCWGSGFRVPVLHWFLRPGGYC